MTSKRIGIIGLVVVLIAALASPFVVIHIKDKEIATLKQQYSGELQKANLEIGRSQTELIDAAGRIKDLDKQIQDEIRARKSTVDMYAELRAHYDKVVDGQLNIPTPPGVITVTVPGESAKPLTSLPFSYSDYRLDFNGDAITKQFQYRLHQKFEIKLAETKLPSGGYNHYAELYELDSNNKRADKLELTLFNVEKTDTVEKAQFRLLDLHLDILFGAGLSAEFDPTMVADFGISFMSYGKLNDYSWRFVRLALGLNQDGVHLGLSPFMYNFGKPLPIVNNLWIVPTVSYTIDTGSYLFSLGIAAML